MSSLNSGRPEHSERSGHPASVGALCLAAGLAWWFAEVAPANAALFRMRVASPPPDWVQWRDRWEYSHAIHFVLDLLGFCGLLLSVLNDSRQKVVEKPETDSQSKAA